MQERDFINNLELPFLEEDPKRPFSIPVTLLPEKALVVNSEFILQLQEQPQDQKFLHPRLAILALDQTKIVRETIIGKQSAKYQPPPVGRVTLLALNLRKGDPVVFIGQTKISLIKMTAKIVTIKIFSPTPLHLEVLNHQIDPADKTEAQNILNPLGFSQNQTKV